MPAAQAPGQPGEARPPGLLKFRIKRNLGVGVSGLVVAAETVGPETGGLPQDLALKLLHPFLQTDSPSEEERINEECFIKEAKQMAKLSWWVGVAWQGVRPRAFSRQASEFICVALDGLCASLSYPQPLYYRWIRADPLPA